MYKIKDNDLSDVKELHSDLVRKYHLHHTKIKEIWHSLDEEKRFWVAKHCCDGIGLELMETPDKPLPTTRFWRLHVPEWNRRDLTQPDSNHLLELMEHRATTSLCEQYHNGMNGSPGDGAFMFTQLEHFAPEVMLCPLPYVVVEFGNEDTYGNCLTYVDQEAFDAAWPQLAPRLEARECVIEVAAKHILIRQGVLLDCLNNAADWVLRVGSFERQAPPSQRLDETMQMSLSSMCLDSKPDKLSLEELHACVLEQKANLQDYLNTCQTEPEFFYFMATMWHHSAPELVPDNRGRSIALYTDKYISFNIFDLVHNATIAAAIWDYLARLLQALMEGPQDKLYRRSVLQELTNVSHFEYSRSNINQTVEWIKKVDILSSRSPFVHDSISPPESEALANLATITSFIQSLSASTPLPPMNWKKGQFYVSRLVSLKTDVNAFRTDVDLGDFPIPISNLLEPGMTDATFACLDRFFIDKTGSDIETLYRKLNDDCISAFLDQYQQKKKQATKSDPEAKLPHEPLSPIERNIQVGKRPEKAKTRPVHSSVTDVQPEPAKPAEPVTAEPVPVFKVKASTLKLFSALFSKVKSSRSITWAAFEAAMVDVGFSVIPKFGSVFTFLPPQEVKPNRAFTIHRPHQSEIEGYKLLYFANRLKRAYGWDTECFVLA
ncbi:hypothetical protein HFD88_003585 [Aspergillus terreus]|nr:hypothetical protein HFD88_003585 [Aspergillus terreus]